MKKEKKSLFSDTYNFIMKKIFTLLLISFCGLLLNGQTNVLTQHNNFLRTGWNNTETQLTDSLVEYNFGLLFKRTVDGQIYSQPLVFSNLNIGGKTRNVVFVATVNGSLYAFDADDSSQTAPLWHVNLIYPGYRPITNGDMTGACGGNYQDFSGKIGIVCTPVIDSASGTLYVVVRSTNGQTFVQYLHAINIYTGAEQTNSPVYITATVNGTGDGSNGKTITFDQQHQNQRAGLLLYNGVVYICWASHCDWGPYHGWIIGYDSKTLKQKCVFNDTPTGGDGGIWMSGQAPAVDDSGYIYVAVGNGTVGSNGNPNDTINRGESLLKLIPSGNTLKVVDFFTPNDYQYLEDGDLDYGSDGVLLIPNTNLSLSGSKQSYVYVINNNKMGGCTTTNSNVLDMLNMNADATYTDKHVHGSPVYFKNNLNQEFVYGWAEGGILKQYPFNRATNSFDTTQVIMGTSTLPYGMPGGMLSVSSNGLQAGTGILWAGHPLNGDANQAVVPGELEAFDANDVTHELWSSNWQAKRDSTGSFAKFVVPTIANGKVYMATFANHLNVYGINPPAPPSICPNNTVLAPWKHQDIGYLIYPGDVCYDSITQSYFIQSSGADIWNSIDAFHYLYQPLTFTSGEMVARIESVDSTDGWGKLGIMFRQTLSPGSANTFMVMTSRNGISFQQRDAISATTTQDLYPNNSIRAPYWLRLVKKGDNYIGYISSDGNNWIAVDSATVPLGNYPYVGIAYTTHNSAIGNAVVDSLKVINYGVLPVGIFNFRVENQNNKSASISWSVSNAQPTDQFSIERGTDGIHFTSVSIPTKMVDQSGTHTYNGIDDNPLYGVSYYRIKQSSIDGLIKFSSVAKVSFNTYSFSIYPNPAHSQIFVKYADDLGVQKISIRIIDGLGKSVLQQEAIAKPLNTIIIDLPKGVAKGTYFVQITDAQGNTKAKQLQID